MRAINSNFLSKLLAVDQQSIAHLEEHCNKELTKNDRRKLKHNEFTLKSNIEEHTCSNCKQTYLKFNYLCALLKDLLGINSEYWYGECTFCCAECGCEFCSQQCYEEHKCNKMK